MKKYERRANGTETYYKLATWDARSVTWRDGKVAYESEAKARDAAKKPGMYRVSVVDGNGRRDLSAFIV